MPEVIILAAGLASRFKQNKLLMPYKNTTILQALITSFKPFVKRIIVVTGHYHDAIKAELKPSDNVLVVYNEAYKQGMFSSIKAGLSVSQSDVFIMPGDMLPLKDETLKTLINTPYDEFLVPSYKHKLGHPLLMHKKLKNALLHTDAPHLKAFRNQYNLKIIEVNDERTLQDIDTQADYERIINQGSEKSED